MPADKTASDQADEERIREEGRVAFHAGEYERAYSLLISSIVNTALRWFREEDVTFTRPKGDLTSTELLVGLGMAAASELRSRGDAASEKISVATYLLEAVAEIRLSLDEHVPLTKEAVSPKIAELTLRGFMLGQLDNLAQSIRLGWLDKLALHEVAQQARRAGAEKTKAKKASVKERALGEAIRIAGINPTLSNEDLARKAIEAAGLGTTIRTATDWVRGWRRTGLLPPQSKSPR